jgi:hypothetical protein
MLLDVAGPLEVLRRTNLEQAELCFEVHYIGPSPAVLTSIGITLSGIEPLPRSLPADTIIMLAGNVDKVMMPAGEPAPAGSGPEQLAIVDWLRAVFRPAHFWLDRGVMGLLGAPKVMRSGFCSATSLSGSAPLPFVISTGAQRSGEICVWMLFLGNVFLAEELWAF